MSTENDFQMSLEQSELLQSIQSRIDVLAPIVARLKPIENDYHFRTLEVRDPPLQREARRSESARIQPEERTSSNVERSPSPVTLAKLDRGLLSMHILNQLDAVHLALLSEAGKLSSLPCVSSPPTAARSRSAQPGPRFRSHQPNRPCAARSAA